MDSTSSETISFSKHLGEKIERFVEPFLSKGFTSQFLAELVLSYATLQEEGAPLFPAVFILKSTDYQVQPFEEAEFLLLGKATFTLNAVQKLFKRCGPLAAHPTWSIMLIVGDSSFRYGLSRIDSEEPISSPLASSRRSQTFQDPILKLSRLGLNFIEIAGCSFTSFIDVGPTDLTGVNPQSAVASLAAMATNDCELATRIYIYEFYQRVGYSMLHSQGGTLIVVLKQDSLVPDFLEDGVHLAEPIHIHELIEAVLNSTEKHMSYRRLDAFAGLVLSMARMDGITVLTSGGDLLGYNFFIKSEYFSDDDERIGGARRRAYETLITQGRDSIAGVFYKSHDGSLHCSDFKSPGFKNPTV